ncbi:unnamed protein product [Adineta steineri]|uniref:Uncharacterized protein n=1 Tax=Adineta steineri TaxID=433720 RepID=A0A815J7B3_9BILA|nr:unnamed protein product [Adineta steineri]CAF1376708.1 unnamed protein product [Adineta steineri]
MSYAYIVDDKKKVMLKKFVFQRWFYASIGILTILPIIFLTLVQIQNMKRDNNEFAFCLLLLVHSGCVIFSMISTALFCRITDALLTTLTIILLFAYIGIHFYVRFLLNHYKVADDFNIITLRLGFVLILLILLLPWASIIAYSHQMNSKEETICSRAITFSWFVNLDTMLIMSILTLNIRSQADFDRHQLIILSIGMPLTFLWLIVGKLLANNQSRHWIVWIIFYILSLIHIAHLIYITYWSKHEYDLLTKKNEINLIPLLIITLICGCTNVLIHFLTIIFSFSLFRA